MAEGLYRKAAEKMNSLAIVNLGVMAEKGTKAGSVLTQEKDLQKAQEYYKHAAQLGNETALLFMDIHSKENTKWAVQNAAEKGNAPAIKLMNKTVGSLLYPPVAEKPKHQNTLRKLATHYVNGFQSK